MAIPKTFFDPENTKLYEKIFSNINVIDAHTHIGRDKDGHFINEKVFVENMKQSGVNKAIVFPLNEPVHRNFSKPNDRILDFYKKFPEEIIPFFRLNPKTKWEPEFDRRVSEYFKGIKLHPRSQDFGIASYSVIELYEKAQENDIPILIHTGFGLSNISDDIKFIVKSFPKLRLILGHSAFVDMENTIKKVGGSKNVFWDTSTLSIFSILELINSVDSRQIVFGSDIPYYDFGLALQMVVDTAIICNKNPNHIKDILGANLERWF
tara:strand:- start:3864 stop:4658 length:795 start_codon:yes stop_codon:yes gene_type:complete